MCLESEVDVRQRERFLGSGGRGNGLVGVGEGREEVFDSKCLVALRGGLVGDRCD
jgi:hypothetical protein